jgi:TetR/AcrR family transcriptional regulator, mexJK operon transcriptional repressor
MAGTARVERPVEGGAMGGSGRARPVGGGAPQDRGASGQEHGATGDPRVARSRAAVLHAGRELFLQKGYAGATMEEIAARAGLTKRTVYNHYADKEALFVEIVSEVIAYAERFAGGLREEFTVRVSAGNVRPWLGDLGCRLALAIVRPEVVALRRLLIGEARAFPTLARDYFDRAPGQVMNVLAEGFDHLGRTGVLRVSDAPRAASQFAYLVAGEPLDRAILVGRTPPREEIDAHARDGVETFLARYGAVRRGREEAGE